MLIGELAAAVGVSRDTVRLYERRGLIRAWRSVNGYRHYPAETVEWLKLIRLAQRLGFSLVEIGASLPQLVGSHEPRDEARRLLREKIALVDGRIDALVSLRARLVAKLDDDCPIADAPQGTVSFRTG